MTLKSIRDCRGRAIQKMPSRKRRWLAGLRPLGLRTAARNGPKNAYSSSDMRLRANMTSLADGILNHASALKGILFVSRIMSLAWQEGEV